MYCRKDIYSYMALEVGSIVEGTVTGLAKFGVFVEIADKKIGLVHISEVAGEYVSDVNDYLKLHDKVKVKIISVDEKERLLCPLNRRRRKSAEGGSLISIPVNILLTFAVTAALPVSIGQ